MSFYITTFCYGNKYEPIKPKWIKRIQDTCKNSTIRIFTECNVQLLNGFKYAWWDVVRLYNNLSIIKETNKPVVHIDIDIIVEKNIEDIVNLDYDFIISREIGGSESFPKECSSILGFGVCSGFYVIKPSALLFMSKIYSLMEKYTYNNYSDQVTIMNYIVKNKHTISNNTVILDGISYTNKIIEIDDIKICVLDFDMIVRDPIVNKGQYANHINIDNVGGTSMFLKYFNTPLENLPLTCRCGKSHLGDNTICKHIEMRK